MKNTYTVGIGSYYCGHHHRTWESALKCATKTVKHLDTMWLGLFKDDPNVAIRKIQTGD
jgi:hypothetical protein